MHELIRLLPSEDKIKKIEKKGNISIIDTTKDKYVIKKHTPKTLETYTYLNAKGFTFYLPLLKSNNNYDIYPYINNIRLNDEEKIIETIYILSILHSKTTQYQNISTYDIKTIYEENNDKINKLEESLNNIRWIIEEKSFIPPSKYLLLRNISIIYISLQNARYYLEKWYQNTKNDKSKKVVLIHNNLTLDHVIHSQNTYLISWNKAKFDSPIYDLISLYKETYDLTDFKEIFKIYNNKYELNIKERYLFYSLISIPPPITFTKSEVLNTKNIHNIIKYLNKTNEFILYNNPTKTND